MTKKKAKGILIFVGIIYLVHLINLATDYSLNQWGIFPRTYKGTIGIFTSPFLHGNFKHLLSNTIPLLVLLFLLFSFNEKKALIVIIYTIIIGNTLVWIFGRSAIHIGASGLIYSLAAFLITCGFIEKKMKHIIVALLVVVLYGGLVWGVFPTQSYISWEAHLFGAIAGVHCAFLLKKRLKTDTAKA